MKLRLITVGKNPPWIAKGFDEYARRLPPQALELVLVAPRRGQSDEARLLEAVRERDLLVILDRRGKRVTSEGLAALLERWRIGGRDVALLIGGVDGFGEAPLARAAHVLSLSDMTFAHPLVRVMVAEQLYRAWSIQHGHPYHQTDTAHQSKRRFSHADLPPRAGKRRR